MKKLFLLFMMIASISSAKDFGTFGHSTPIKEKNFIELIQERAAFLSEDEKKHLQQKIKTHYQRKLTHPSSLNLPETTVYSFHTIDPSVTVNEDIKDIEGKTVVQKGVKYNPLSDNKLSNYLLFFDGEDTEQIKWAKKNRGTWILVKGHPLDLEASENIPVYFDQMGVLCKKFKISSVPARVSQMDNLLKVELVPKRGKH